MVTKMANKLPTDGGPVMVVTAKGVVDTCVEQQDILGTPCPFCWNPHEPARKNIEREMGHKTISFFN